LEISDQKTSTGSFLLKIQNMKTIQTWFMAAAAVLLILTSGCSPQRVVWSPDGTRAAVLDDKGLYLCDANGKLSGLLVSNEAIAEWFPDSQKLALLLGSKYHSWADLQKNLRADERDQVVEAGQKILKELIDGQDWKAALKDMDNADAVAVYLKDTEGVKEKAGADWKDLDQKEADFCELVVGTINGDQISLGAALIQTLRKPIPLNLRVSPNGRAITMTTEAGKQHGARLWVVAADGSAPAQIVSDESCAHPDWTKDGRSLVYINASGAMTSDDDLRLSSLTRRQVINDKGAVEIQSDHEDLAGMLFDINLGVRCLSDGRILFVAYDVQLPATAGDMPTRPQVFTWDPRHQATLTRMIPHNVLEKLPDELQFFEVSPDEKSLLMAAGKGAVMVLSFRDGKLTSVQSLDKDDSPSFPSWRGDEVCYMSPAPTNSAGRTWEVNLWKNGTNRVISADWPLEFLSK
jgi:hypothetical protein